MAGILLIALSAAFPAPAAAAALPYRADTVTCQAATVIYGTSIPALFAVNPPTMYAQNVTAQRDLQGVAWQARVVRPNGSLAAVSGWRTAWAYDNAWASFAGGSYRPTLASGTYYVIYDMYWYATSYVGPSQIAVWAPGYTAPTGGYFGTSCRL